MAQVIDFPKRPAADVSQTVATLDQSINQAVSACLTLSRKFEDMIADLEKSIALLSVALAANPKGTMPNDANKLKELQHQLAAARSMIASARQDLSKQSTPGA